MISRGGGSYIGASSRRVLERRAAAVVVVALLVAAVAAAGFHPSARPSLKARSLKGPLPSLPVVRHDLESTADLTAIENRQPGTGGWVLPLTGKGDAEGYFDDVSVAAGESIGLHLRSSAATVDVRILRLGWYGGSGARLVGRWSDVHVARQRSPTTDPRTGLIVANWSTALTIRIPAGWLSGLYLALLEPHGGKPQYASFIVREAKPLAPILWVSPVTTHEAYNYWGGKSLYPDSSFGANTVSGGPQAVSVSFDRPFVQERGAGLVLRWEYPFVRWIERQGYDVGYAADVDLERDPSIVAGRRLIVFVGHPEYWSRQMRATLDAAIKAGTNVAFFSANEIYWRVRLDSISGPRREVTCYRRAALDPEAAVHPEDATTLWRDRPAPDPESLTIGEMYGHVLVRPADFVVSDASSWIYAGTGVRVGDRFRNLVGQEYDRVWPGASPSKLTIVARSPVFADIHHLEQVYGTPPPNESSADVQNATLYTAPSGATVFAAGTMQWAWALDPWGTPRFGGFKTPVDSRVQRITKNILDRLGR